MVLVVLFAGAAVGASGVVAGTGAGTAEPPDECHTPPDPFVDRSSDSSTITVDVRPAGAGTVELVYRSPGQGDTFTVHPTEYHEPVEREAFEATDYGSFEYDGSGEDARLVLAVDRSEWNTGFGTEDQAFANHTDGDHNSVVTRIPSHSDGTFSPHFPEGGTRGSSILFAGEITEEERITHGAHTLRVVRAEGANSEAFEEALPGLRAGGERLEPRSYRCESLMVVYPDHVRATAIRTDSFVSHEWVDDAFTRHPPLHEYVHNNQQYRLASEMEWYTEGSAVYVTARLLLDEGLVETPAYNGFLGSTERDAEWVDLTDPNAIEASGEGADADRADYTAGALVLAELDRDLRENGNATVFDLFTEVGGTDDHARYNISHFHADYRAFGGTYSEAEVRALLSDPDVEATTPYHTKSGYILSDEHTRSADAIFAPRELELLIGLFAVVMLLGLADSLQAHLRSQGEEAGGESD